MFKKYIKNQKNALKQVKKNKDNNAAFIASVENLIKGRDLKC